MGFLERAIALRTEVLMKFPENAVAFAAFYARRIWSRVREWCGDAAYERYLRATPKLGPERKLSAEEFYLEQINRRYSQPNRCC